MSAGKIPLVHPAVPRIRGRVGEADKGQGVDGKFFAEVSMWDLAGTKQIGESIIYGPFDSEALATAYLREVTEAASKAIEAAMTGNVTGKYHDMMSGELRKWGDEQ